jgi:Ca-activated chloride channel family protein
VLLLTSDTKAEWVHTVTEPFNAAQFTTANGRPIVVTVQGHGSPGESQQAIIDGTLQPTLWSPGDISWIEVANQVVRDQGRPPLVTEDCPRLVSAATGFAMWRPMAETLGWPDQPIGWAEIVALAADPQGWASYGHPEWGQFKFGHAHPEHSTTGFSMLATLAYAALDTTTGLTPALVKSPAVIDAFRTVELHTYHYGLSTRGLMTLMATRGPSYLHAVTASETAVLKTNEVFADTMRFPYVFIFPAEGTFWSDNPACLVAADWVSDDQGEAAQIYRDYLLQPAQQDMAVTIGLRPSDPSVALHAPIALEFGTDPRVSPQTVPPLEGVPGETAAAIIDVFKLTKKKATVIVVLDVSQSMVGEKIANAIEGTVNFINQLAREDEVIVYTFNDTVQEIQPSGRVGDVVESLTLTLDNLFAIGNTALFDSVCQAVDTINALRDDKEIAGEERLYGIVLLSDGADTNSQITENDMFNCLPSGEAVDSVKIFTIAYGDDADEDLLLRVANRTNGKTFTGDPTNLDQIYLSISAEQ